MKNYYITKLLTMTGIWMAMQCLSCDSDTDNLTHYECIDGFRQCADIDNVGHFRICESHRWSDYQVCPGQLACKDDVSCMPYYSLEHPQPADECDPGVPDECNEGLLKYCYEGRWAYLQCFSGVCQDAHSCAKRCEDGEFRCFEPPNSTVGMIVKCAEGVWVEDEVCGGASCKSDTECGQCTNTAAALYSTWVDYCQRGTDVEVQCTHGEIDGKFSLCTGSCNDSSEGFCREYLKLDNDYIGESYQCIDGEWVRTECNGPCNADSTGCAEDDSE